MYSLIQCNLDCFQLHRLVQTVIRHRLPADRQEAVLALVIALLAAHPGFDDPANRAAYARLAPHPVRHRFFDRPAPEGRRLMLATVLPVTYLGNRGDAQASKRRCDRDASPNGVARQISYTSGAQASFRSILVR